MEMKSENIPDIEFLRICENEMMTREHYDLFYNIVKVFCLVLLIVKNLNLIGTKYRLQQLVFRYLLLVHLKPSENSDHLIPI